MRYMYLVLVLFPVCALGQDWVARYSSGQMNKDEARALAVDRDGNCYVAGFAQGVAIVKYSPQGDSLWARVHSDVSERACGRMAAALDASGHVLVVSGVYPNPANGFRLTRYTPEGELSLDTVFWHSTSTLQPSNVLPVDMAIAASGLVYVTGCATTDSTGTDWVTCCFDRSGGVRWARYFDGQRHGEDRANSIALDRAGRVVVAGYTEDASRHEDAQVIVYDTAGVMRWSYTHKPNTNFESAANDASVDPDGQVWIAGWENGPGVPIQSLVLKLNANGDTLWSRTDSSVGHAVALDGSGGAYVVGQRTQNPPLPITMRTWKYDGAGQLQWKDDYQDMGMEASAGRLALLAPGRGVYALGLRKKEAGRMDFLGVRYGELGNRLWVIIADTTDFYEDRPNDAALDGSANVFLAGRSKDGQTGFTDFLTMKFRSTGDIAETSRSAPTSRRSIVAEPTVVSRVCRITVNRTASGQRLHVVDASGQVVKLLALGGVRDAGVATTVWHLDNNQGRAVPEGVYFVALESPAQAGRAKVIVQR